MFQKIYIIKNTKYFSLKCLNFDNDYNKKVRYKF